MLCVAARPLAAQPLLLEIRPTVGDTLHLRLEQMVEMRGTTRVGTRDSTMTMSTSMAILARAIILAADSGGARVLTVTDSVVIAGSPPQDAQQERIYRALKDSRVEMRVLPDGSSEIISDPATLTNELRSLVAQMPATLPRTPVQVGERWSRVVTVPIEAQGGIPTTASLKTTFRFDSLSRNREIAYVSLLGELSRSAMDSASGAAGVQMTGTIKGGMTVDRKRGWMTDSRAVITLKSVLPAARGSRAYPMHFNLTITQRMRALDKR
jgi:hypothetical protein